MDLSPRAQERLARIGALSETEQRRLQQQRELDLRNVALLHRKSTLKTLQQ